AAPRLASARSVEASPPTGGFGAPPFYGRRLDVLVAPDRRRAARQRQRLVIGRRVDPGKGGAHHIGVVLGHLTLLAAVALVAEDAEGRPSPPPHGRQAPEHRPPPGRLHPDLVVDAKAPQRRRVQLIAHLVTTVQPQPPGRLVQIEAK